MISSISFYHPMHRTLSVYTRLFKLSSVVSRRSSAAPLQFLQNRPLQIICQIFGNVAPRSIFALRFAKPVPKYKYKNVDFPFVLVRN